MTTTETNAELYVLAAERIDRDKAKKGFSYKVMQKLVARLREQEDRIAKLEAVAFQGVKIEHELRGKLLLAEQSKEAPRSTPMKTLIQKHDDGTATILLNPFKSNEGVVFAPDAIGPLPLFAAEQLVQEWERNGSVKRIEE